MYTKHTPGPFHTAGILDPDSSNPTVWIWGPTPEGGESGEIIAKDVALKNAPLLTAAPDLLEALQSLLLVSENADETGYVEGEGWLPLEKIQEQARAAIARATEATK